ncbi:MAG: hypothetical protein ABIQ95_16320 [Bdellovibrionia bacterium]
MVSFVTILYLSLPFVIFFLGWLKLIYGIPLTGLLLFSIYKTYQPTMHLDLDDSQRPLIFPNKATLYSLLAIALVWTALSGTGGIGSQTFDWQKHNAILNDLIYSSWPTFYKGTANPLGPSSVLIYYLSFYLPAAVAGKLFGWLAANAVSFLWCYMGIALSLVWFYRLVGKRSLWVLILFIFAGGLDVIGTFIMKGKWMTGAESIEWWAGTYLFQYSSNSNLITWVPQHAIGGWLATSLIVNELLTTRTCARLGLFSLGSLFWSPFVTLGLIPIVGVGIIKNRWKGL